MSYQVIVTISFLLFKGKKYLLLLVYCSTILLFILEIIAYLRGFIKGGPNRTLSSYIHNIKNKNTITVRELGWQFKLVNRDNQMRILRDLIQRMYEQWIAIRKANSDRTMKSSSDYKKELI